MVSEINNIPFPKFVHLRVHSSYSLSEGAIRPEEIGSICANHGMPAVAVTDSGNLFGLLEIAMYCNKYGVQLIPAVEANFAFQREGNLPNAEFPKMLLLAKDEHGYKNLLGFFLTFSEFGPGIYNKPIVRFIAGIVNSNSHFEGFSRL